MQTGKTPASSFTRTSSLFPSNKLVSSCFNIWHPQDVPWLLFLVALVPPLTLWLSVCSAPPSLVAEMEFEERLKALKQEAEQKKQVGSKRYLLVPSAGKALPPGSHTAPASCCQALIACIAVQPAGAQISRPRGWRHSGCQAEPAGRYLCRPTTAVADAVWWREERKRC